MTDSEADMKEGFKDFDRDKDGLVTKDDLRKLFKALEHEISEAELDNMIRVADRSGTGKISFEDFKHVLHETK